MGTVKNGGGAKRPPPSSFKLEADADDIRARIAKLTSADSVPDPIAVKHVEVTSSGLLSLDYALGVGGFAQGHFHSIEGPPGSGKTALALQAVGEEQRLRPESVHAIVDVEGTVDEDFAQMLGCNTHPSRFIILRPETAEEACIMSMSLMGYSLQAPSPGKKATIWRANAKLQSVSSVIYDSWAGSPTDEVGLAQLARVGAEWIPKISTTGKRTKTTLYWINQIREKPGVSFGDPRYSPGGFALKHAQSSLLWVSTVNVEKDLATNLRIAHDLKVEIRKNKLAPPFRVVHLHLNYTTGFDRVIDAFALIERKGISFKETPDGDIHIFKFQTEEGEQEEVRANKKEKFIQAIQGNPEAEKAFLFRAREIAQKGFIR